MRDDEAARQHIKQARLEFAKGLEFLINQFSQENGSDTPDFILAQYLLGCLSAWNDAVKMREKWYGREVEALNATSVIPTDISQ